MLIEFEDYKNKLSALLPKLEALGESLQLDDARNEVEKLEEESAQEGFWNDTENSQKVQKRISALSSSSFSTSFRASSSCSDSPSASSFGSRALSLFL